MTVEGSDDFPRVSWETVERMVAVLWECTITGVPQPDVHAHPAGGVLVTWRTDSSVIELSLFNDGRSTWFRSGTGAATDLGGASMTDIVSMVARDHRSV